ncbi:RNA-directed DNA polymerase from mobile element jockey-like protein [Pitangus sulphuratus]|nr:RNA-directed DNA polymerase from mobile element jockey-like protein [Pitangus sulphuratus]
MGPDGIHPRVMRELAEEIAKPLSIIYQQSWLTGEVPDDWKLASVTLIHKKGWKEDPGNFRPVSLTSVPGKVMEQIMLSAITQHLQDGQGIRPSQQGFGKGRSCLVNLISFYDQVTHLVDEGKAVDVSVWTSAKPLTPSPTEYSWKSCNPRLGQGHSVLGQELPGGPGPESAGERGCIQLSAGHQWCSPGISAWPSSV